MIVCEKDSWVSLEMGNRIDFAVDWRQMGLGTGGIRSGEGENTIILKETTGIRVHLGDNLVQWKLHGICESNFSTGAHGA